MDAVRGGVGRDRVERAVREGLGGGRHLAGLERLRGGSTKGVYRVTADDGSTAVLYVWSAAENYWPAPPSGEDPSGLFADPVGVGPFLAAHRCLSALGVRVPALLHVGHGDGGHAPDVALVEDLRGGSLESLLDRDPAAARPALESLGVALEAMRRHRAPAVGPVAGTVPGGRACERIVLDRALGHLAESAARVGRLARIRDRLEAVTRSLAAAVTPRGEYGLVHGELGPDHVHLDAHGAPTLIDIEGAMYFDVEWEHAFVALRFGEHYRCLRPDGLDAARMRFYTLALGLSLVAGPLRLLDGDFPDRAGMRAIAEGNVRRVLGFLDGTGGSLPWTT